VLGDLAPGVPYCYKLVLLVHRITGLLINCDATRYLQDLFAESPRRCLLGQLLLHRVMSPA
jgi:hypothetical protein